MQGQIVLRTKTPSLIKANFVSLALFRSSHSKKQHHGYDDTLLGSRQKRSRGGGGQETHESRCLIKKLKVTKKHLTTGEIFFKEEKKNESLSDGFSFLLDFLSFLFAYLSSH